MTPLAADAQSGELIVWRLEREKHFASWHTGEGAFLAGGRWNTKGRRVVYTSSDPSTAILEVAVHKHFETLARVPHLLLKILIKDGRNFPRIDRAMMPVGWCEPGASTDDEKRFGDSELSQSPAIAVPSAVSSHSWNVLLDASGYPAVFELISSEPFELDRRLLNMDLKSPNTRL